MMEHPAQTAARVQLDATARAVQTAQDSVALACSAPVADMVTMAEGMQLGLSALRRMGDLQKSWIDDWSAWARYAQSLEQADTVPKLVERSGNIVLQAEAQMVSQVQEWSELMDNIGVSYRFWVSRQLTRAR